MKHRSWWPLAYCMILFGIFLVDRFMGLQCLLYAVTMLVYLPALLPLKSARPSKWTIRSNE